MSAFVCASASDLKRSLLDVEPDWTDDTSTGNIILTQIDMPGLQKCWSTFKCIWKYVWTYLQVRSNIQYLQLRSKICQSKMLTPHWQSHTCVQEWILLFNAIPDQERVQFQLLFGTRTKSESHSNEQIVQKKTFNVLQKLECTSWNITPDLSLLSREAFLLECFHVCKLLSLHWILCWFSKRSPFPSDVIPHNKQTNTSGGSVLFSYYLRAKGK